MDPTNNARGLQYGVCGVPAFRVSFQSGPEKIPLSNLGSHDSIDFADHELTSTQLQTYTNSRVVFAYTNQTKNTNSLPYLHANMPSTPQNPLDDK